MKTKATSLIAALVAALTLSACAESIKENVLKGVQATHEAVGAAQDGEISVFNAGLVPTLTPEKHRAYHAALVKFYDAEKKALLALQAWRSGDPMPNDLNTALAALDEALNVIRSVQPSTSGLLAPITDAVAKIRAVVALFQRT